MPECNAILLDSIHAHIQHLGSVPQIPPRLVSLHLFVSPYDLSMYIFKLLLFCYPVQMNGSMKKNSQIRV